MMKYFLLFLLILIFFTNCGKDVLEDEESTHGVFFCEDYGFADDKVYIRLYNMSAIDFDSVVLNHQYHLGGLRSGEYSCTIQMDSILSVPHGLDIYASSLFDGSLQCAVGVGLHFLEPGYYTYPVYAGRNWIGGLYFQSKAYELRDPKILFNPYLGNCSFNNEEICNYQLDKANVRIINISAFDYCDFKFEAIEGDEINFGKVAAGDTTCYVSFNTLKELPFECSFTLGEKSFKVRRESWGHYEELIPGKYSYSITLKDFDDEWLLGDLIQD